MSNECTMDMQLNAKRFSGQDYIELYHRYRPTPPLQIIHQSLNYLKKNKADIIIDLGCGSGLSTGIWSDYANKIIGVEPSESMIRVANKMSLKPNVTYQQAFAHDTKLETQSADIIYCSQSFHWMEPQSTLMEINRLLKNDGVLVIYDVKWPPEVSYEYENAYAKLFKSVESLFSSIKKNKAHKWNKNDHLLNIENSGHFKFTKQSFYHKSEPLDKEKFIGIALSQGGLEALLKRGFSNEEIGIKQFKKEIELIGKLAYEKMTYNYSVIYALK